MMQGRQMKLRRVPQKDGDAAHTITEQHLNRFLSKTYHMVDSEESSLICWAPGGDSFLILDVEKFSHTVLPKYFKHAKFTSFVRQLNFYGFRKIRSTSVVGTYNLLQEEIFEEDASDTRQQTNKKQPVVCRFYHEFFKANQPKLMNRIQRATKSAELTSSGHYETLRYQLEAMNERMNSMSEEFDSKLQKMRTSIEQDYQQRLASLEASYKELLTYVLKDRMASTALAPSTVAAAAAASNEAALRRAALASMVAKTDNARYAMGVGVPSSLMLSSFTNLPPNGGVYSNLRNTNPGNPDMSALGMLGKFR